MLNWTRVSITMTSLQANKGGHKHIHPLSTWISIFWTPQHLLHKHSRQGAMKIDATVWYVASLDSVNLPKILLGWSRIQLSPYPKLPKDRTLGTNRCSASLCFSWPAALGIKASSSFRTSTATFTSSSSSMVYKGRGSQVRRRGTEKSLKNLYFRYIYKSNTPYISDHLCKEAERTEISNTIWERGRRYEQRFLEIISTLGKSPLSLIQAYGRQLDITPPVKAWKWWL